MLSKLKTGGGRIICLLLLSLSLLAQDTGQFTLDAVTQKLIGALHSQSDALNTRAVFVYNTQVANWKLNNEQRAALNLAPLPAPEAPVLSYVNDEVVRIAEADWANWQKYQIFSYRPYVPPPAPVKKPVPGKPSVLVGASTGNGFYACVPGDDSPDGKKFGDGRGVFQKHLYATPFGNGCGWTLLFATN